MMMEVRTQWCATFEQRRNEGRKGQRMSRYRPCWCGAMPAASVHGLVEPPLLPDRTHIMRHAYESVDRFKRG